MPEGLETGVGERGEALSVGERQLVALVRAQLGDPGLLILDEATSAVDPATERRITEALRRLSAGRTVITIAHRLSTAEGADRVFVFDAGELVEEGTHEQLAVGGRAIRGAVQQLARQRARERPARAPLGCARCPTRSAPWLRPRCSRWTASSACPGSGPPSPSSATRGARPGSPPPASRTCGSRRA